MLPAFTIVSYEGLKIMGIVLCLRMPWTFSHILRKRLSFFLCLTSGKKHESSISMTMTSSKSEGQILICHKAPWKNYITVGLTLKFKCTSPVRSPGKMLEAAHHRICSWVEVQKSNQGATFYQPTSSFQQKTWWITEGGLCFAAPESRRRPCQDT